MSKYKYLVATALLLMVLAVAVSINTEKASPAFPPVRPPHVKYQVTLPQAGIMGTMLQWA
jgi:hypothetical protein